MSITDAVIRRRITAQYTKTVARLAAQASANPAAWQRGILKALRDAATKQAVLGLGGPLTDAARGALERGLAQQSRYLHRFTLQITTARLAGTPLSAAYIGARSALYAGFARAQYYAASEGDAADGYVADYIARDDAGTCEPCLTAEINGPYLPGEGPLPGVTCLGGARCRCRRELRYSPAKYAALTGAIAA